MWFHYVSRRPGDAVGLHISLHSVRNGRTGPVHPTEVCPVLEPRTQRPLPNALRRWVAGLAAVPHIDSVLLLVFAACVARLWVIPLGSGFWTDEAVTVFVVHQGGSHPSLAAAPQVPQSIYYWLPRLADELCGTSEVAYRVPSLLAMMLALGLLARVSARLIHRDAGWLAVFACLALRSIDYSADDARPYALGILISAAGVFFLIRWLDSARRTDAVLFTVSAALLWRTHLVFWPFYLVFALYAAFRLVRRETQVRWIDAAAVLAVLSLSLAPVAAQAIGLLHQAQAHVIAPEPDARVLCYSLKFGLLLACWLPALLLSLAGRWRRPSSSLRVSSVALILAWWLSQPLVLFAFSHLTGNSLFVDRYLAISLPGAALAATALAGLRTPSRCWKPLAAVLGIGVLIGLGQWHQPWYAHSPFDWRTASQLINQNSLGPATPVICPSAFIEGKPPVWTPRYRLPGFLYAYLSVYPIRGTPYLFPFDSYAAGERYGRELMRAVLPASPRFFIYGDAVRAHRWQRWFTVQPELAGWRSRRLLPSGGVDVVMFESPPDPSRARLR